MIHLCITLSTALISGLLGVVVTLIVQRCVAVKQQKVAIFQTLLANRHQFTAEVNVQALNMIDVVFYKHDEVRTRFAAFIDATNARPADGTVIITKYLRLVESVAESIGMKKLDWERINSCFYSPIALAERNQENDLLRKAMLQNQMNIANQITVRDPMGRN